MPLYTYVKSYPKKPFKRPKLLSWIFIACGIIILAWVGWPIVTFKLVTQQLFSQTVSPLQDSIGLRNGLPQLVLQAADDKNSNQNSLDYSNPNIWFPTQPQKKMTTPIHSYTLSIPKLKINNAMVLISGDSLDNNLIHYGGTALPGTYGTTVIFGHSTLPQLYDPKNYKTIFSLLPTLKPAKNGNDGDEIIVNYDGIIYRYMIYDMVITKPTDISALEQRYDDSYLTLITCVPPGTFWDRLDVKAKLVPLAK